MADDDIIPTGRRSTNDDDLWDELYTSDSSDSSAPYIHIVAHDDERLREDPIKMARFAFARLVQQQEEELLKGEMRRALLSDASVPWMRTKLMVVGEGRAGKSQTVRSILGKPFQESWDSTFGVTLSEASAVGRMVASEWESAVKRDFALGVAGKIALGKQNEDKKQAQPKEQKSQAQDTSNTNENLEMYKIDDVVVKTAKKEVNALRLSIWDYGGQTVFQTLHHLFLTRYGIYVIVFDLETLVRENPSTEHLIFWYRSLKLHAPEAPVLLVGTGLDKFSDEASVVSEAKARLKAHLGGVVNDDYIDAVHMVSNKDKRGIPMLRLAIESLAAKQDFVHKEVSIKWMRCLDIVLQHGQHMKFSKVVREARKLGIETQAEVTAMLVLFHEFGVLLYFRSTEILSETVIADPQWLVDAISKVIRDPEIHNFDNKDLATVGLVQDAQQLFTSGIASRDLLEYLWNQDQVNYLLDLMQKLLLLSPWGYGEAEEESYLFPSMLVQQDNEVAIKGALKYRFEFDYLPTGIFERLICLFCMYGHEGDARQSPRLYKDSARFSIGTENELVHLHKLPGNTVIELSVSSSVGRKAMYIVNRMLVKIRDDLIGDRLSWSKTELKEGKFQEISRKVAKATNKERNVLTVDVDAFLKANF